jgi:hypothetical protein
MIYRLGNSSIDQDNIPERNAQVTIMRSIYCNASLTIIWLGEHSYDSPMTIVILKGLHWGMFRAVLNEPRTHDSVPPVSLVMVLIAYVSYFVAVI